MNAILLKKKVENFNARTPVGTAVVRHALINPAREPDLLPTRTRSQAFILGGHTPVVYVEGRADCVHVDSLKNLPAEVAKG